MPNAETGLTRPKRSSSFDPSVARAFGRAVRAERLRRHVAQDAFALEASIDRSYFGKLERGERQPSLTLFLRIASGLGLSGSELLAAVETQLGTHRDAKSDNSEAHTS